LRLVFSQVIFSLVFPTFFFALKVHTLQTNNGTLLMKVRLYKTRLKEVAGGGFCAR
jgi:hypothetical protein